MSTDFKNTLNLPNTEFPMKANLPQREPLQLKQWQEEGLYQKIRQWAKGRQKFILHDGPPYANGNIHLGHALNKILKDIIIKSKTLNNYDCPFVPGWDCHGLPIEREVEKKLGRAGDKVSPEAFRAACREYAGKQIINQKKEFMRLGIFADWDNSYHTMDYSFEADIIRAFKLIYQNGHLQKGYKPVHWCTDCRSSLAEAEVEYKNKTSPSIDVKFTVTNQELFLSKFLSASNTSQLGEGEISVLIWTTTPWTLPANQAVALAKDFKYALVQVKVNNKSERWVVASDLIAEVTKKYSLDLTVLAETKGENLELLKLQHPFEASKQVPIVLGDNVTLDSGTGCVHTAPGHGPDDYILGLKYNLPIDHEVQDNGVFNQHVEFVGGQHVFKANNIIVDLLSKKNKLVAHSTLEHSYPHCWRHKTPIIFRATAQWFISMSKKNLREDALEAIKQVKWIPEWGFARIEKMVAQRPDWCISRQRTWCVPMPLFINNKTNELHPKTDEIIDYIAELFSQSGIEAWYKLDKQEILSKFGSDLDYEQSQDTLDVWFDSGVTHYAVLKRNPELAWPADLYLEGSDQHRGWFGSSLMTGVSMYKTAPYKQVLTHGYTVDQNGYKMSKSIGNVIEPQEINDKWGADILRLWVASADYRGEIVVGQELFQRIADVYRRIRNTARFLLANLNGFDPNTDLISLDKLVKLDAFALKKAVHLQKEIIADYESYGFRNVYQKVHDFCSFDLGSFYLDIIKDRQYTIKSNSLARKSAQTAIYYIVKMLAKWAAPILSFTAEEIWQNIPKTTADKADKNAETIFMTLWDKIENQDLLDSDSSSDFSLKYWDKIIEIRNLVNKQLETMRAAGNIGSALQAEVVIYADQENYDLLKKLSNELRFVLITSTAELKLLIDSKSFDNLIVTDLPGIKLAITKSKHEKCIRCWHYREDVGSNAEHPEVCQRCLDNVFGEGETRLYA
ncbi:MAG: isoleucine--tRNA ligase [Gammaproteobacteria bacterium]|nr:isoleucine--tRNA ligase [Gammaproteobacteria bacterium]